MTKENTFLVGDAGDFEATEPFSFGAWVLVPKDFKGDASVLARMGREENKYRGWELALRGDEFSVQMIHRFSNNKMEARSTGKAVKREIWQHLFVTFDGSGRTRGIKLFVDGVEVNATRDNNQLQGSIRSPFPLRIGRREGNNELNHVAVQDVRIYRGRLSSAEVRAIAAAPRVNELLAKLDEDAPKESAQPLATDSGATREQGSGGEREENAPTEAAKENARKAEIEKAAARAKAERAGAQDALRDYFLVTRDATWQRAQAKVAAFESEQALIRARSPVTLVQAEKNDSEPMANVLFRGQYDQPKDKVGAATPAALHALPANAPRNRLGLAQWIVSPENPLTARVTVNRFWQEFFGRACVKTCRRLRHDERAAGQSGFARLAGGRVLGERLGCQTSLRADRHVIHLPPERRLDAGKAGERSAEPPLQPRPAFRMDAEMCATTRWPSADCWSRNLADRASSPTSRTGVGGGRPCRRATRVFIERDTGEALYRRSLYTFWKRAAPPATMDIFNAPSREVCSVRRERTNTPLQALATLNDPQFVEAARHLAQLALTRGRNREDEAIDEMARRVLARPLTSKEKAVVKRSLAEMRSFYAQEPEAAKQFLSVGESKASGAIPAPELAAMTMVANQLMNLDEALNK